MTNALIKYVENLIRSGRHRWLSKALLEIGLVMSKVSGSLTLERLAIQGKMLALSTEGHRVGANHLLVQYAQRHPVSWPLLRDYISYGDFSSVRLLLDSPALAPELKSLLKATWFRANGDLDEAVHELTKLEVSDYSLKLFKTEALRNLFHQRGDHESIAIVLIELLNSEPDRILIKEAIAAAGSAEASDRQDLLSTALDRLISDIDAIVSEKKLFKKHWKDAIEGSISTFDLTGAIRIAHRAKAAGFRAVSAIERLTALENDFIDILHVLDEARNDILVRCGRRKDRRQSGDVILVMPAAALRTNRLDYPEFRADIRRCLKGIVNVLDDDGIPYLVKSRIRTHGKLGYRQPFFSYHTISDNDFGIHFKESDRPSLFSFDERGYAGWSGFADTATNSAEFRNVNQEEANLFFESDREVILANRISKYAQMDVAEKLPEKFIFVALQVIGDAVQKLAFTTPFAMLDEVIETAKKHRLAVVVKRHPACKSQQITSYLAERSDDIVLASGNIHDIIPSSQAVCVINSGVGAEAILYEKPVYVFGRADYMSACFVCEHPGDFERTFEIARTKLSSPDLRRFWFLYRNSYACTLNDDQIARSWIARRVRLHLSRFGLPRSEMRSDDGGAGTPQRGAR